MRGTNSDESGFITAILSMPRSVEELKSPFILLSVETSVDSKTTRVERSGLFLGQYF